MKKGLIWGLLLGVLVVCSPVLGANVNLLEEESVDIVSFEVVNAGVYVGSNYFVFSYENDGYRIKPDRQHAIETDFEIITDYVKVAKFLMKYPMLGDVEVIGALNKDFGVPIDYLLDFKKLGVEE